MPFFVSSGFEKGQSQMLMIWMRCALNIQYPILLVANFDLASDCY